MEQLELGLRMWLAEMETFYSEMINWKNRATCCIEFFFLNSNDYVIENYEVNSSNDSDHLVVNERETLK